MVFEASVHPSMETHKYEDNVTKYETMKNNENKYIELMFRIYVSDLCFGFRIRVSVSVFVLCLCIRVRIRVYIRIHVFCFAFVGCFCMRIRFPFLYSYAVLYSCSYACSLQDVDVSVLAFVISSFMFSLCVRVLFF